jgi:hypothetical protein
VVSPPPLSRQAFGMSCTGVERRYASNSGHEQNSVCISYTQARRREGDRAHGSALLFGCLEQPTPERDLLCLRACQVVNQDQAREDRLFARPPQHLVQAFPHPLPMSSIRRRTCARSSRRIWPARAITTNVVPVVIRLSSKVLRESTTAPVSPITTVLTTVTPHVPRPCARFKPRLPTSPLALLPSPVLRGLSSPSGRSAALPQPLVRCAPRSGLDGIQAPEVSQGLIWCARVTALAAAEASSVTGGELAIEGGTTAESRA